MSEDFHNNTPDGKPRARSLGVPFEGVPGKYNAITDVAGIKVGYTTLIEGNGPLKVGHGPVRTGVTAILPRGQAGVGCSCAAGVHSFNGNGEMTGMSWVEESGGFNTPIVISNTHAVGTCHRGVIDWIRKNKSELSLQWLLPISAETWDGYLNDINGSHVNVEHVAAAIDKAQSGAIEEGSVGGGTGMNCFAFKGGNGTSSRIVDYGDKQYTVGVFLQANFGARQELVVAGMPIGRNLLQDNPMEEFYSGTATGAGSCIAIVATDAPMLPNQCKAMARRVSMGLARTGTTGSHFSGDIFLAFSTGNAGALDSTFPRGEPDSSSYQTIKFIPWNRMDNFYTATVQCVEEAVMNALTANVEMIGRDGHRSPALPHDIIKNYMSKLHLIQSAS